MSFEIILILTHTMFTHSEWVIPKKGSAGEPLAKDGLFQILSSPKTKDNFVSILNVASWSLI